MEHTKIAPFVHYCDRCAVDSYDPSRLHRSCRPKFVPNFVPPAASVAHLLPQNNRARARMAKRTLHACKLNCNNCAFRILCPRPGCALHSVPVSNHVDVNMSSHQDAQSAWVLEPSARQYRAWVSGERLRQCRGENVPSSVN